MKINYYPEEVQQWASSLSSILSEEGFFEDYEVSPVHGIPILERRLCEAILPNWLNEGDMNISEKSLEEVMSCSITEALLYGMREKGLIDSIENETGEELFFLTNHGKESLENYSTTI